MFCRSNKQNIHIYKFKNFTLLKIEYGKDEFMKNNFDNIDEMVELIQDELPECEFDDFNCKECSELEECYYKASIKSAHEFAESVNNGGYDSEEEFWENLD